MTKILSELITDKTSILDLTSNEKMSDIEKIEVLDLNGTSEHVKKEYIKNMYYKRKCWYYFKKDKNNYEYPFSIIDELMGMFLCKNIGLNTLDYKISIVDDNYGLASKNFKTDEYVYHTFSSLIGNLSSDEKKYSLDLLKLFCINKENEQKLLENIFKMFTIDILMLQKDRCGVNLQFQIKKDNEEIDLAPMYDFSNCSRVILCNYKVWNQRNVILDLNENNLNFLLQNYPEFKKYLEFCLEQQLSDIWSKVCEVYNLNQDCALYERISDYYKIKEDSVKSYVRQLIK